MFDNENSDQNKTVQGTGNGVTPDNGQANNYAGRNYGNYSGGNYSYGNNASSYNGGYSNGSGYSGAGNSNGGTGYGNTGNYNAGGYGGNYSGNGYGTYQYSNYQQPGGGSQPPKKGGAGKKVAAVIAVALVLCLGLGAGYYSMTKINKNAAIEKQDQADASSQIEEKAEDSSEKEKSKEEAETASESSSDAGISQTETTSNTKAVVTDVTDVVSSAMPAIVSINNNYTESLSYFGQKYTEDATASGSGIIVGTNDSELLIATNYHVIEGADSLEVQFVDSKTASAEVKGTDSDMDLAVIAVQLTDLEADTRDAIAIASLGDSDSLVVGEPAIAIGNALGYGQSVTTGVISAVNRVIDLDDSSTGTFIQTDAAINPGNSGGALLNINGEVIGINSNKIGGSTIEGMGYAIPISTARPIIEQLMTEKTRAKVSEENRGYLGISGVSVTSEVSQMYGLPTGVYVAGVTAGGGAEAAGVKEGDIITKFDSKEISSMDDLQNRLAYYEAGETITITVMRQSNDGYASQDITITLGNKSTIETSDNSSEKEEKYEGNPEQDALPEEDDNEGSMMNPFGENGFGFGFDFGN